MKNKEHRLNETLDETVVEYSDGTKLFVINKRDHRNIDPSVEWSDGGKRWCFKGGYHRIGGSFSSYSKLWCIHGKEYTKQQYFNIVWDI